MHDHKGGWSPSYFAERLADRWIDTYVDLLRWIETAADHVTDTSPVPKLPPELQMRVSAFASSRIIEGLNEYQGVFIPRLHPRPPSGARTRQIALIEMIRDELASGRGPHSERTTWLRRMIAKRHWRTVMKEINARN
jgi:hypothetical protein